MSEIKKKLQGDAGRIEKAMVAILVREGEKFVSDARSSLFIDKSAFPKGDYTDRTTNLRNSIGYYILKNNEIVKDVFPGSNKAKAEEVIKSIPPRIGYRLIGIAGESYGIYVESRGYNVITSQSLVIIDDLKNQLSRLRKKTEKFDFELS